MLQGTTTKVEKNDGKCNNKNSCMNTGYRNHCGKKLFLRIKQNHVANAICLFLTFWYASIAQLVERALRKRTVVGSIPTGGFCFCVVYTLCASLLKLCPCLLHQRVVQKKLVVNGGTAPWPSTGGGFGNRLLPKQLGPLSYYFSSASSRYGLVSGHVLFSDPCRNLPFSANMPATERTACNLTLIDATV